MAKVVRSFSLLLMGVTVLNGCTLMAMKKETEQQEIRVQAKERELHDLETQQASLKAHKEKLLTDLQSAQTDIDKLSTRLEWLRKENLLIIADTEARKKEKHDLDKRLKTYQQHLASVKNNTRMTEAQKQKKIEDLKEQIRLYLKMGLR